MLTCTKTIRHFINSYIQSKYVFPRQYTTSLFVLTKNVIFFPSLPRALLLIPSNSCDYRQFTSPPAQSSSADLCILACVPWFLFVSSITCLHSSFSFRLPFTAHVSYFVHVIMRCINHTFRFIVFITNFPWFLFPITIAITTRTDATVKPREIRRCFTQPITFCVSNRLWDVLIILNFIFQVKKYLRFFVTGNCLMFSWFLKEKI